MAAVRGDKTLAELAQQFDIHVNQITQWKVQLLNGAAGRVQLRGPGISPAFHTKLPEPITSLGPPSLDSG